MGIKLSKPQLRRAYVCAICSEGSDEPADIAIVKRKRGWVHVLNNSVRCPGQGDDDTDDRAYPLAYATGQVTIADLDAERRASVPTTSVVNLDAIQRLLTQFSQRQSEFAHLERVTFLESPTTPGVMVGSFRGQSADGSLHLVELRGPGAKDDDD